MVASIPISASFKNEFAFVDRWVQFFSLKRFFYNLVESIYNWSVSRLLQDVQSSLLLIEGAKLTVENYDKATATMELKIAQEALNKFIKFESLLASVEYLGKPELKSIINSCISSLYDVEFILRKKRFEGDLIKAADSDFKQALSDKSKTAILASL